MRDDFADLVVVGGGFVSRTAHALSFIRGRERSVAVIPHPFGQATPPLIESDRHQYFDPMRMSLTNGPRGGLDIWGGAVTFDSSIQYLTGGISERWRRFVSQESCKGIPTSTLLSLAWPGSPIFRGGLELDSAGHIQLFSGFPTEMGFVLSPGQARNPFREFDREYVAKKLVGSLREINPERGGTLMLTLENKGFIRDFRARRVVFAGGPIGNAFLSHLVGGQDTFTIGNHLSWVIGRGVASREVESQLRPSSGNGTFVLYNHVWPNGSPTGASVRFRRIPHQFRSSAGGKKNRFSRAEGLLEFEVLGMLELTRSSGVLRVVRERSGLNAMIETRSANDFVSLAREVGGATEAALQGSPYIEDFAISPEIVLQDAAHYFGTTPISEGENLIGQSLELIGFPGVFVAGSSLFDSGGSGHPTLLAMKTALLGTW